MKNRKTEMQILGKEKKIIEEKKVERKRQETMRSNTDTDISGVEPSFDVGATKKRRTVGGQGVEIKMFYQS